MNSEFKNITLIDVNEIWKVLDDVKDPEIHKISVVDMGIILI